MKKSFIAILIFSCSALLGLDPWNLDRETRDRIHAKIDASIDRHEKEMTAQGKENWLVDFDRSQLNFDSKDCYYCHIGESLQKAGFEKKWVDQPKAHCFGSTLLFIEYFLHHPQNINSSCSEILSAITNDPSFEERAHSFSVNQHSFYRLNDSNDPLELNPAAMKTYFLALIGASPSDYQFVPLSAEQANIDTTVVYAALEELPQKLIMIGYTGSEGNNHCIAVSTYQEKLFVFDFNKGMYEFPDLETLSCAIGKVQKDCRFRWLVTFSIDPRDSSFSQ